MLSITPSARYGVSSSLRCGFVALTFLMLVARAHAGQSPAESYDNRLKGAQTLGTLGPDLFGEQVNLLDGNTAFHVTDISVPTNSGMPLMLGRKLKVSSDRIDSDGSSFAAPQPPVPDSREAGSEIFGQYWDPDIPVLRGVYDARFGWVNYAHTGQRCSGGITAPPGEFGIGTFGSTFYEPHMFWSGISLAIPGRGDEMLLSVLPGASSPSDGLTYVGSTRSQARVACLPTLLNGSGEGYLVVLPDGTRYWFNWMATHTISATESVSCLGCSPTPAIPRVEIFLYASKVQDRHGNTINYAFDSAFPHRLTTITSSESTTASPLKITLDYNTSGKVEAAHSGDRTWTYAYSVPGAYTTLSEVVQPDASSKWTYVYNNLYNGTRSSSTRLWESCTPTVGTMNSTVPPGAGEASSITMTHPSGATGLFEFRKLIHGTNRTPGRCTIVPFGFSVTNTVAKIEGTPMAWQATSLYRKTISGPGLANQQWNYLYDPSWSWSWDNPCTGCPISSQTTVSDPDGVLSYYQFGNNYGTNAGQLLKTTVVKTGVTARITTNTYLESSAGQPYPQYAGSQPHYWTNNFASKIVPLKTVDILQDGVTFTRNVTGFDLYAQPTRVVRSSTLGYSRAEIINYSHQTSLWVLGQVASVTEEASSNVMQANTYDAATGDRLTESQFGKLQSTLAYNADGTLKTVKDGLNQSTTLSEYKRGIPQKIVYANGDKETAVVDDLGRITSITSASTSTGTGYATSYEYDAGGRINKITHPGSDSVAWAVTDRVYQQIFSNDLGLTSGHWRSTETTGKAKTTTWYDARWRPLLSKTWDDTDATTRVQTVRMTQRRYDAQSRVTFASYAKRDIAAITSVVDGITTQYDALGRLTRSEAASELPGGLATLATKIRYLTNFRKEITSPRNMVTTFDYQVFDQPGEDAPVEINEPLAVKTTINRDIYGKPTAITRSGMWSGSAISASRQYVYDDYQRLCKTIEPEAGSTVIDYDNADNIQWIAAGQALTSLTACQRTNVANSAKATNDYDSRNRLIRTWYQDTPLTAETNHSWTPDSLPSSVSSAGTTWTYAYNRRRLLESECLATASGTYNIGHRYNTNGHEDRLSYPDTSSVLLSPNALGETTQVGSYVSLVKQHPNGALAGFHYGNGIVHSTSQTTRGLPDVSEDVGVIKDDYGWDENGNVATISSGIAGLGRSRTLGYDDRDRLTSAVYTDPGRSYAYSYDPLDNLRTSSAPGRSYVHNVNASSNRLTTITEGGSTRYAYAYAGDAGARGHVTTRSTPSASQAFTVDRADRITALGGLASYAYDGNGRRTSITEPGGNRTTVYAMDGRLLYEVGSASNDRIFCNGFDGPCGGSGGTVATKYIYLGRHLIAKTRTSGVSTVTTYLHTDGLGSPVAETNSSGTILSRTLHEPYGAPMDGTYVDGPGYTGHVVDSLTGLSYMQQRYMDPVAGRFLSMDPAGTTATKFNAYSYANNSPYTYIDPDGRDSCLHNGGVGGCNTPIDKGLGTDDASKQGPAKAADSLPSGLAGVRDTNSSPKFNLNGLGVDQGLVQQAYDDIAPHNRQSIEDDQEYGVIRHDSGVEIGKPNWATGQIEFPWLQFQRRGSEPFKLFDTNRQAPLTGIRYFSHTHGGLGKGSEFFSGQDMEISTMSGAPAFMANKYGNFYIFKPGMDRRGKLLCDACAPN